MTLTLAAVYAPLAFTPGRTGRLFVEFALTLAGAVIVSGFVALTLTPMLCSKLLRHNPSPNRFDRGMETFLVWLTERYKGALRFAPGAPLDRAAGDGIGGRRQLVALQHREERAGAARGPRRHPRQRQRARRRDARVHRALPAGDRAHRHGHARVRPRLRRRRQPDGVAGHLVHAHRRLGRPRQEHAATGARAAAAVRRAARRQRIPDHAAEPGAGLPRAFGQLRHRHQRQLREPGAAWRSSSSPRWTRTPGSCSPTPTCG